MTLLGHWTRQIAFSSVAAMALAAGTAAQANSHDDSFTIAVLPEALLQTLTRFPRLGSCTVKVSCDERFQRTAFYRRGHPMGGALVLSIRHQLP
ncbi:hypothetical protein FA702_18305 (plasmid) [Novosphingobium sp. EMRT-2]|nr:hypothetical protein FA702_17865 [Novosphingobium sp. EMRT-2]QCI95636.1 hypothetical protein FA702_18305 [Novosphingobium sp. EMRT-2]